VSALAPALRDAAMRWIADDPDPDTRVELQRVLAAAMTGDRAAADDLADRMSGTLQFGTAGLRGPVRAGPNGMNVAVVRRTTAGLAQWLRAQGRGGAPVVVGRDARRGSDAFATAAAEVLAGAGFAVRTLPDPLPTPVLAFAVREIGAVAGVQITASHNPPADNGYKVYVDDGGQLAPPADAEIEAAIAAAPPAVSVPVGPPHGVVDVREGYLDRVAALPRGTARTLRVALTPLHGVGGETAVLALARAGFTDVHVVPAQAAPDAAFPTVAFPNPEEPGVTDALLATAERVGADLAVALDPDADRCALGLPTADGWRMLTGDETGALLGDHILRHTSGDRLVATTVVSSSMLGAIAAAHGARFAETLTGFKWIVRAGHGLVYGYEEALGYCVDPDAVRDKDGIAAAVLACDLAATLKTGGASLLDRLDELAVAHGVHATAGLPIRMEPAARDAVVDRLRAHPPEGWTTDRPAPDVLVLRRGAERAVIRPSGTEPKLKAYLQVVQPVDGDLATARAAADARLQALRAEVEQLIAAPGSAAGDHRV
jgi:phosphomannomutase